MGCLDTLEGRFSAIVTKALGTTEAVDRNDRYTEHIKETSLKPSIIEVVNRYTVCIDYITMCMYGHN